MQCLYQSFMDLFDLVPVEMNKDRIEAENDRLVKESWRSLSTRMDE